MLTEQRNSKTHNIDRLSTLDMVRVINDEDRTVADAVARVLPDIARAVDAIVKRLKMGGRLLYVGAGTSGRLGILDAAECVPTYSTPPEMIQGIIAGGERAVTHSVEGAEDDQELGRHDLTVLRLTPSDVVFGIAASGRTPYVLAAIDYAKEIGAKTIGLSCNVPAVLLDAADIGIGISVGPEVITGSTRMKAGTAQKLVLNMISTASMVKMGKVYGNLMVDVQVTNEKLAGRARRIISQVTGLDDNAACTLLEQSGQQVKTAIAMHKLGIGKDAAQQKLDAVDGYLQKLIEEG